MKKSFLTILLLCQACLSFSQTVYLSRFDALEDLNYLLTTIESVHYQPFFKTNKKAFLEKKAALLSDWKADSISLRQLTVTAMKLVALLSNGHTTLDWTNAQFYPALLVHQFIPFKCKLNDQQELVVTHSADSLFIAGQVVRSINGIKAKALYEEVLSYTGGIFTSKNAYSEQLFPLYLFFNKKLQAPYQIQLKDQKTVHCKGIDVQSLQIFMNQQMISNYYSFEILDNNVAYIAYNSCQNYEAFSTFLSTTFQEIHEKQLDKLIIDIRVNGGGDSRLNDLLLSYITERPYRQMAGRYWKVSKQIQEKIRQEGLWQSFLDSTFLQKYLEAADQSIIEDFDNNLSLPQHVPYPFTGKSCFLIGPSTFSSANLLADAVKTYHLSTLIGTATGEYSNDFGEIVQFQLPHAGSYFMVSTTYDIGADGNQTKWSPIQPDVETGTKDALVEALQWIHN